MFLDCELEELEAPQRYRPDSLAQICKTTKFSESEIKRMYRGFKAHCPNGMVKEETFKIIYSQFFPQGGLYEFFILINLYLLLSRCCHFKTFSFLRRAFQFIRIFNARASDIRKL